MQHKIKVQPSSYSGGARRSNGVNALPQVECTRLLQTPSKLRYLFGKQIGGKGQVSPNKLKRTSISWRPRPACSGESLNL